MAHLHRIDHHHHHLIHHHSSHELIHSPPSSVSSSAMASTTTPPHGHQLHQQSSNPHLQRQESASSLQQLPMSIGSPPDHLQYPAQQNGRPADHRRLSSGNQHTLSGLSGLTSGEAIGLQINDAGGQNQQFSGTAAIPMFDPARSPPNKSRIYHLVPISSHRYEIGAISPASNVKHALLINKRGLTDLAHVPCKFFRQNQCQAGRSCPFSHSMDPTTESTPCKYFQKGNCKFGGKCANAHVLPDGRRVNRPSFTSNPPLQLGGRIVPEYPNTGPSALANSLSSLPPNHFGAQGFGAYNGAVEQPNPYDMGFGGVTYDPAVGSPRDDNPSSPTAASQRTLGPLDAILPPSLDSNGYSWFARHGPQAASVPSRFGMESPPASLPQNSALQSLRRSAFADENDGNDMSRSRRSPPLQPDEASFSQRILQNRLSRTKFQMSSSLPRPISHMMSDESPFENSEGEDLIPTPLLQDVLGDRGKEIQNRRMSRPDHDEQFVGSWHRRNTAPNTPAEPTSTVGSPGSRFGPLFSRQRKDEDSPISAIGHVGSPLRNSYAQRSSPPFGPIGRPDPADSGFITSPTRSALGPSRLGNVPRTTPVPVPHRIERGPSTSSIKMSSNDEDQQLFPIEDVDSSSKKIGPYPGPVGGLDLASHNESMLLSDMSKFYVSR
ncbi:hypothetical protein Dda_5828 [Drechslerella dactyloides]|uniref:C3H1-type domain-containing protein n=1 Tax=Drechslerella dactyloides TaxID=74499 RepID=A0AAD6IUI2_DREDA|nr:hypothetical protein Dda_5828 [Drechslerella dactyloides]